MSRNNGLDRMKQSEQARIENLKKWRASRVHEETLPSGLPILLRDVDLPSVIFEDDIPNTLINLITSKEFQAMDEEEAGKKVLAENKEAFNSFMKRLITVSLAQPEIGDVADDKHILYSELSLADKMFIFNFLNREAQAVRSFRDESKKSSTSA